MPTLTKTGTGKTTRIPTSKTTSGGFIPPDKTAAGLAVNQTLSPDPTTAEAQAVTVIP